MRYFLFCICLLAAQLSFGQKTGKTVIADNPFTSLDGEQHTLTEIIKANKGKVIYIDFWASWCGPCRQLMPASKTLHEKLKGEDVVFVYISIDQKPEAWKAAIKADGTDKTGIHYLRKQREATEFLKFFYIYSIPHYMLIDKEGNFVSQKALPPNDSKLERQLRKLL